MTGEIMTVLSASYVSVVVASGAIEASVVGGFIKMVAS